MNKTDLSKAKVGQRLYHVKAIFDINKPGFIVSEVEVKDILLTHDANVTFIELVLCDVKTGKELRELADTDMSSQKLYFTKDDVKSYLEYYSTTLKNAQMEQYKGTIMRDMEKIEFLKKDINDMKNKIRIINENGDLYYRHMCDEVDKI